MRAKSRNLITFILTITLLSISSCGGGGGSDSGGSSGSGSWSTQLLGNSNSVSGNGIAADSSGNIYLVGSVEGDLLGNSNSGNDDIFLIKYSSSASIQWTKLIGTSSNDKSKRQKADWPPESRAPNTAPFQRGPEPGRLRHRENK